MSSEHTQYEIFLSYARKDDMPVAGQDQGWVRALYDQILADHRRFSTEPLRIFYDTHEIRDMDDWRHRILGALRSSKILLVCLSPNYAASEYCRWEWDEYARRQVHQRMGQDSVAAIYFVELPGAGAADIAAWLTAVQRGNFTDMRAWFPEGARALQRAEVQRRMAALGQSLWERIERARRADKVPGNLRRQTPYFVGRREELRRLHEHLATGAVGLVTTVHGLGGQGKTELAVAYGHAYADFYPAGLWLLGAEGKKELLPLIGELAFAPEFGYQPSEAERADANLLGRAVLAELHRRAQAAAAKDPDRGAAALVILDNVSEPALLASSELGKLPRAQFLRILATTRLGAAQLRAPAGALAFVEVGSLQEEDALCLIRDHQPARDPAGRQPDFASPAEEAAAREIVRELGGLTLAVEQVAVYLGLHPEIAPSAYLAGLRSRGLTSTDRLATHEDVQAGMAHQQKRLSAVLEATLAPLDPATRTALSFAARLPPDMVPWPWLRALTLARHPELAQHAPDEPDPWVTLRRALEGLRLVAPGDLPEIGRMHRLVAAHLAAGVDGAGFEQETANFVAARSDAIYQSQILEAPWELDSLLVALPLILATTASQDLQGKLAREAVFLSDKVLAYRNLCVARTLLDMAHGVIERQAASDQSNAEWQRDLSVSHEKLGNVQLGQGDLAGALSSYRKALVISERLAASDPSNAGWQRGLSVSHEKVGDVQLGQGDLAGALSSFRKSLAIRERLASSDPSNARWQRDLSVSHCKLGDVQLGQGDLAGALSSYRKALVISEHLAASDPSNAGWQRDLSVSHDNVGNVQLGQGDLAGALSSFRKSLAIRERLAASDPSNARWQSDLSVSHGNVGNVQRGQGDLAGALSSDRKSLAISERLAGSDQRNAEWQRDLSVSHERVGDVLLGQGDLPGALSSYRKSLAISERLAASDQSNAEWQRDLSVSHNKVGDVQLGQGDLAAALSSYRHSLAIRERLAASDPSNTVWQRNLSVSHDRAGGVQRRQGDLAGSLSSYRQSLAIRERLAASDPCNAGWQRDLSLSHNKVGDVQLGQGDLAAALSSLRKSLPISERLAASDPTNAGWQRDVWVSYGRMGNILARTSPPESKEWFRKAFQKLSDMKQRGLFISPADEQFLQQLRSRLGVD